MTTTKGRTLVVVGMLAMLGATALAQAPAITRTVLNRADMTARPGFEAVTAKADFPVGGSTGKHTHPGDEVTYIAEGTLNLEIEGMPSRMVKSGEAIFVPAGKVHNVTAMGGKAVAIANYLVEKGKPLTAPVQ